MNEDAIPEIVIADQLAEDVGWISPQHHPPSGLLVLRHGIETTETARSEIRTVAPALSPDTVDAIVRQYLPRAEDFELDSTFQEQVPFVFGKTQRTSFWWRYRYFLFALATGIIVALVASATWILVHDVEEGIDALPATSSPSPTSVASTKPSRRH